MTRFESVLAALVAGGVRFVVVGGVAVVLQGYPRLTADLDLAIDLGDEAVRSALAVLADLGLVPLLPVKADDFADPAIRSQWIKERNLRVFTLRDPTDPLLQVDLFAENPLPFEELWQRATTVDLGSTPVRVASIDDLITMKRMSGRPRDADDISALTILQRSDPTS